MSGPRGSGKASFYLRLLQKLAAICTEREFGGGIVWCYSEKTAVPKRRLLPSNITYQEGVPEKFGGDKPRLVILDDLLNDVYSKQVGYLFTRGSHQRNISLILITQNLFHQGCYCSDISLNAHFVFALKKSEIRISLRTWPIKSIPKIVLGNITPNWMRRNDPTVTSS